MTTESPRDDFVPHNPCGTLGCSLESLLACFPWQSCPVCGFPLRRDELTVHFDSGNLSLWSDCLKCGTDLKAEMVVALPDRSTSIEPPESGLTHPAMGGGS